MDAKNSIFGKRRIQEKPAPVSIFRNVRNTAFLSIASIQCGYDSALAKDLSTETRCLNKSSKGFNQLCLTVSFHSSDTHDLSGVHGKRNAVDGLHAFERLH